MKTLIAYFSHADENYNVGFIKKGNTQKVAELIQEVLKEKGEEAGLFCIKPLEEYPSSYSECIAKAKKELKEKARPAIKEKMDLASFDVIYLGYPNWWGDLPMCVYTFLENGGSLKGKTIIPFCTHEGSGLGNTENCLKKAFPEAEYKGGLAIQGIVAQQDEKRTRSLIEGWL